MEMMKKKGLSQNQLKIVATISMVIDHIGAEIFPQIIIFRIIGRLAFPIFSYFIYEGFQYTRDKKRYFLRIISLGLICAIVYYIYSGEIYGNVLITFSLSIIVLYCIEKCKNSATIGIKEEMYRFIFAIGCIAIIWFISSWIYIDYGVIGVLLPVFAEIVGTWKGKKNHYLSLLGFSIGVILLAIYMGNIQYFCLFAVLLLVAYNGQRGVMNMKKIFYWFYPAHLLVIGMISMVIY